MIKYSPTYDETAVNRYPDMVEDYEGEYVGISELDAILNSIQFCKNIEEMRNRISELRNNLK